MKLKSASSLNGKFGVAIVACSVGLAACAFADESVTLKVVKVDSQELVGENGAGTNAVDGDPATFWHTEWQEVNPRPPHEIIIELSRTVSLAGFKYLPRQDESDHGLIKDYEFYVSDDGKNFGQPVKKGTFTEGRDWKTIHFEARPARFIKLKALSEINDEAWTAVAEIGIIQEGTKSSEAEKTGPAGMPRLRAVKADSEELVGENGSATNAVDGDPATFWHTQWQDASPDPPHEIIIELIPPVRIKGFTYLPRQDEEVNGTIQDYEFYVSNDGKDFGKPVNRGTLGEGKQKKTVTFSPVACRFIKLRALSEINGAAWTSAAEIGVVPE
jgi:hypothetical protein